MKNIEELFPLPYVEANLFCEVLVKALRQEVFRFGLQKVVVGVSGGIDSALSLALSVQSFGPNKVKAILLPYKESSRESLEHGRLVCEKFQVDYLVKELTPMAEPYFLQEENISSLRKGNFLARLRMIILYDFAAKENAFVIGTSNKTEILLGYSTLWGDMASAVNPVGDLYKFQVRELAHYLGIPQEIIKKPPSADLWPGQTDEGELGLSYDIADRILYQYVDLAIPPVVIREKAKEVGIEHAVNKVLNLVTRNQYKRVMPTILKISFRTIGREFRYPRDWST